MKCRICKKTKEKPNDVRIPYCQWDGNGAHPRFVRYKKARKKPEMWCCNCSDSIYLHYPFWKDMETGEIYCFDCGMLIYKGMEYAEQRMKKDAA